MSAITTGGGRRAERRSEAILKKAQAPRSNITKEEHEALKELKNDNNRMVLTADKGVSIVVMDREDYNKKADELLIQQTYISIPADPTTKYKNKLITLLKTIKAEGGISDALFRRLHPKGAGSPKFYLLPKVHKEGMPLRPIVSSIWAVTYTTSKELARILKPLVGKSPYHVHNTKDFIQQLKCIHLQKDESFMSYDVKALFTSVPIQSAIDIMKQYLEEDRELQQRTSVTMSHITCLLEFCLKSTYFTFQVRYYKQQERSAMG